MRRALVSHFHKFDHDTLSQKIDVIQGCILSHVGLDLLITSTKGISVSYTVQQQGDTWYGSS